MSYVLSIADEEEMAFRKHCQDYVLRHPESDLSYQQHFSYMYNSTRERMGFLELYQAQSKFY